MRCDDVWYQHSECGDVDTPRGAKVENAVWLHSAAHKCENREEKWWDEGCDTCKHHQAMAKGHAGWREEWRMLRGELAVVKAHVDDVVDGLDFGVGCMSTTRHHQIVAMGKLSSSNHVQRGGNCRNAGTLTTRSHGRCKL
ncbi:hypothetical protein CYMTET_41597 [Cymbomonas tetramitiformis]|uniref:Uncharacterized protein n=1 Tax=Cymbomonas tetramitiformis TaxID=36881 RepID=A0AAE0C787_9CHLO|nr:hypothetical protein CYMTET_41597 [Cymbomonas tetramitiformis]